MSVNASRGDRSLGAAYVAIGDVKMKALLPKKLANASERTRKDVNIVPMSVSFFMVFGAFFTMGNIQTVIIENAKDRDASGYVEGFDGDGFISLSIVYAVSTVFDFLAPSIVAWLGLRLSLILAGSMYALFDASFYILEDYVLYIASGLLGAGNAILWIGQGVCLALNSDPDTIARNSGGFYIFLMLAGLLGNTFTYYQFKDSYEIHPDERDVFVTVLLVITCTGIAINLLYLPMPWVAEKATKKPDTPWTGFVRCMRLFATPAMLRLVPYFCYIGFFFTFWQGVYGPSLTFARSFEELEDGEEGTIGNSLTGLHGIFMHTGMIVSSSIFTFLFKSRVRKTGHWPFVVIGCILHVISFFLVLINVPADAPIDVTYDEALLITPSNKYLAIFTSFLMGFGLGFIDTQTLTMLGGVYADQASQAFAVYKICQHSSSGVSFAYSGYINLYWQLGIMFVLAVAGAVGFTWVDLEHRRQAKLKRQTEEKEEEEVEPEKLDT